MLLVGPDGSRNALVCNECVQRGVTVVPQITPCHCGKEPALHGRDCHTAAVINDVRRALRDDKEE